jgi:predicted dehydrogenase
MIRLAVSAPDGLVSDLSARLLGASVDSLVSEASAGCTAVAFLDPDDGAAQRAQASLAAGKDVLLLAGPWLSDDGLKRLSAAARQAGRSFAVLNPDRFAPSRRLIREQLDSGHLGAPGLVRIHHWGHSASAADELPAALILDLDIATWLMGEPPELAYAVEAPHPGGGAIQVHLGFPAGGMALIDFAQRPPGLDSYQSLSVIGSTGAAYEDDQPNMQLVYGSVGGPLAHRVSEHRTALVALVQSFVTELLDGQPGPVDNGASWLGVLEIARAVRRSVESRQAIELAR